jgi:hypothetical protein
MIPTGTANSRMDVGTDLFFKRNGVYYTFILGMEFLINKEKLY